MKTFFSVIILGLCLLSLSLTQSSVYRANTDLVEAVKPSLETYIPFVPPNMDRSGAELCALEPGGFLSHNALLVEEGAGQGTLFADLISDSDKDKREHDGCTGFYYPEHWMISPGSMVDAAESLVEA